MDQAPGNSRDEELVNDGQLDDAVQFLLARLEHGIEFLGLRDGTRETIQDESVSLKIDMSVEFHRHIYFQRDKRRYNRCTRVFLGQDMRMTHTHFYTLRCSPTGL